VEFIAPGHPLLDALVDLSVTGLSDVLETGTVLIDPNDPSTDPWLLAATLIEVYDGTQTVQAKEFAYLRVNPDGTDEDAGLAPYLDFDPLPEDITAEQAITAVSLDSDWLSGNLTDLIRAAVTASRVRPVLEATRERILPELDRAAGLVERRLTAQMDYLTRSAIEAEEQQRLFEAGEAKRAPKVSAASLKKQVYALQNRLTQRLDLVARQRLLSPAPPRIVARALVLPQGLVDLLTGADWDDVDQHAKDTAEVDRRAVDAVLAAERAMGRTPVEMPHNNPGFDVASRWPGASRPSVIIEVKGRIAGAEDFVITHREVLTAKNTGEDHRLALVEVSPEGPEHDRVRYLVDHFRDFAGADREFGVTKVVLNWPETWNRGGDPV
jgi:hypothetical protein